MNGASTRKLLVAFHPSNQAASSSDFLTPVIEAASPRFIGIKSRQHATLGMMVFLGRDLTMPDLFAKLVDSGVKIEDVTRTARSIETYFALLQDFKIGNIVAIEQSSTSPTGFILKKIAEGPPAQA